MCSCTTRRLQLHKKCWRKGLNALIIPLLTYTLRSHPIHSIKHAQTFTSLGNLRDRHNTLQEKQQDHCNQPTAISTSLNTVSSYITLISTALQTWETCWRLEHSRHVISCGIFSKAELRWTKLQDTLNLNTSPSSAFLGSAESTSEAAQQAGPVPKSRIVLDQPNQPVPSSEQKHTNRHTQERLGYL